MAQAAQTIEQTTQQQEVLRGAIARVVFHNPGNGYCVLKVMPEEDSPANETTAVGYLSSIREGDEYEFTGTWKNHPKFGRQFAFTGHELIMPTTRAGIIVYLSNVARGVGPVKAGCIVDVLGEGCLEKIQAAGPEALTCVPGITVEQAEEIHQALMSNRVLADLSALICRQGVTPRLAARIHAVYGADSVRVVKENPYVLADEVFGIGFLTADRVARAVGIAPDSPHRVQAAVQYILREAENDGHCYLRPRDIMARLPQALGKAHGLEADQVGAAVERLVASELLIREENRIYQPELYKAERRLAEHLKHHATAGAAVDKETAEETVAIACDLACDLELDDSQFEAIVTALTSNISIITGGPGTGKSTITRILLDAYDLLYPDRIIYLCSPTGRAAKRLQEVTGRTAQTIHRLLEYSPLIEGFQRNLDNPLKGPGILVADEFSMADLPLAAKLFDAIPNNVQVVLVGDVDQLPSVGPGSVLRDLILSKVIPTVRLNFTYRQKEGSRISYIANLIREGVVPEIHGHEPEILVFECEDQETAAQIAVRETLRCIDRYGIMGCQALAPMYKGVSGVNRINSEIREAVLGPGTGQEVFISGTSFRVGDKVMVIKNDYKKNVFNGDVGRVVGLAATEEDIPTDRKGPFEKDEPPGIYVSFSEDAAPVFFNGDDTGKITLAYCCTIHKLQGSEFPVVVLVLTRGHWIMLQRNLFYTGLTRAKRELVLVLQGGAMEQAIRNDKIKERLSRLKELLASG